MGSCKIEGEKMTIEEAKKVYKKYQCSLFVMAREDRDNYELYKELGIDNTIERKWKLEMLEELTALLEESGDSRIFNQLYDLAVGFYDKERLACLMNLIDKVIVEDVKISLCIAETIIGRKVLSARSGMIFWAYDIGLRDEAITLIRKAISLVNVQTNNEEEIVRASRDQKKIREIKDALQL